MRTRFGTNTSQTNPKTQRDEDNHLIVPTSAEIQTWEKQSCEFFDLYFTFDSIVGKFEDALDLGLLAKLLDYHRPDYDNQEPVTIWDRTEKTLKNRGDELEKIVGLYKKTIGFNIDDIRKYNQKIKKQPLAEWHLLREAQLAKNPTLDKEQKEKKADYEELFAIIASAEVDPSSAAKMSEEMTKLYSQYPRALAPIVNKLKKCLPDATFPPSQHHFTYTDNKVSKIINYYYPKIIKATTGLPPEPPLPPKEDIFVSNLKWLAKHMAEKSSDSKKNHSTKNEASNSKSLDLKAAVTSLEKSPNSETNPHSATSSSKQPEHKKEILDSTTLIKLGEKISYNEAEQLLQEAQKTAQSNPNKLSFLFEYINNCNTFKAQGYSDPLARGLITLFHQKVVTPLNSETTNLKTKKSM